MPPEKRAEMGSVHSKSLKNCMKSKLLSVAVSGEKRMPMRSDVCTSTRKTMRLSSS